MYSKPECGSAPTNPQAQPAKIVGRRHSRPPNPLYAISTASTHRGAARKIAKILGTTVGYLLDETEQENLFKDPEMLKRLNEIEKMDKEDKNHILYAIDAFIKSVKLKNIAAL